MLRRDPDSLISGKSTYQLTKDWSNFIAVRSLTAMQYFRLVNRIAIILSVYSRIMASAFHRKLLSSHNNQRLRETPRDSGAKKGRDGVGAGWPWLPRRTRGGSTRGGQFLGGFPEPFDSRDTGR
jgi:hypothetical protein